MTNSENECDVTGLSLDKLPAIVLDERGALDRWVDLFFNQTKSASRERGSRDDFGDPSSRRLFLRRRDIPFEKFGDYDFGIYAGPINGKETVLVKHFYWWVQAKLVGYAEYESLAELKHDWELD